MTYYKVVTCCKIKNTLSCIYCYYTINTPDKVNCIPLSEKHLLLFDIVRTVYHLVIYMQSNKIHNLF